MGTTSELAGQPLLEKICRLDPELAAWMELSALKRAFFRLLTAIMLFVLLSVLVNAVPTHAFLQSLRWGQVSANWAVLLMAAWLFLALVNFTRLYYSTAIETRRPIKLSIVALIYVLAVATFAATYRRLYLLDASNFSYPSAPVPGQPLFELKLRTDFWLFSAFQGVGGSFYGIVPSSIVVSVANWIQAVFNIVLLALCVASYVEQRGHEVER